MVIDELIVIENGEQKKVDSADNKTVDVISFDGVDYHFAKETEALNGVCKNAVAEPIIDLKVSGNSVQDGEPTPSNPILVESVGDKTKNLIDWDLILENTKISKVENGYYTESYATDVGKSIVEHLKNVLKPNTTYSLSRTYEGEFNASNGLISFRISGQGFTVIRPSTGFMVGTFSLTQEQIDGLTGVFMYFNVSGATISNLMLVEGEYTDDTFPEYEPYGYKVPIKVSGKNLLNKETSEVGHISSSGVKTVGSSYGLMVTEKIYVEPSTSYVYSGMGDVTSTTVSRTGFQYDENDNPIKSISPSSGGRILFTTEANCRYVYLQYKNTEAKPMLEKGSIETTYEPYIDSTTNIYLNEPLRKLGNYADYIDYENKKVYRIISKGQINDSSKLSMFSSVTNFSIFFTEEPNLIDYGDEYKYNPPILSETFKFCACSIGNSNSFWTANYEIGSSVTTTYKRICFSLPNTITSTTMAKEWLTENPIDYIYIANAFVEESIDIPEISTADGTNVISVDTEVKPSEFNVGYWKQILAEEVEEEIDNILQTGSNILIISTGAEITQNGTNLTIGG